MSVILKVVSDSMTPLIPVGTELTLLQPSGPIRVFDIILFRRHGKLVVHYVWRAQGDTCVTRSLKNIYRDEEPVALNEILGRPAHYKLGVWTRVRIAALCLLTGNS